MKSIILALSIALNPESLSYSELEEYYWDCDTMFMKEELSPQDMWSCLSITDEFQKHFKSKQSFRKYWNMNKVKEWKKRGYTHERKD